MRKINKNIENEILNSRTFTIGIDDDKILLPDGDWGTTQDFLNYYSSAIVDDAMTKEEAMALAEKTNVAEGNGFFDSDNKYQRYARFDQYHLIQIGKIKFDLKDLSNVNN